MLKNWHTVDDFPDDEVEEEDDSVLAAKIPDFTQENLMLKKIGFFEGKTGTRNTYDGGRACREKSVVLYGAWWRRPYTYAVDLTANDATAKHILRWMDYNDRGVSICGVSVSTGDMPLEFAEWLGDRFPVCGQCSRYDEMFEQSLLNKLKRLSGPGRAKTSLRRVSKGHGRL